MGSSFFEIAINLIKMTVIFLFMIQLVPLLVWVERRGSAFIQNRFGPNRVGPLGLTQLLADAVKFIFKEDFRPSRSMPFLYYLAPVMALIPGALAFGSIPLSAPFQLEYGGEVFSFLFQGFDLGIGIVFVLGVSSLGAYSLLFAGWGSGNKYSLMGALRASAQMISYELALGLSLVGILLIFGSFSFSEIIKAQQGPLNFKLMGESVVIPYLPNWGIFYQPLGFVLFFAATFAETNRTPFDLPEAEAELVAGYHTEYGGLKMLMFYMGEYGHMMVASALLVTFYFGGWDIPHPLSSEVLKNLVSSSFLYSFIMFLVFMIKMFFFLWIFIWVRWTLPRFRYDQLMDLGWKTMLPWALFNTVATAFVVIIFHSVWNLS